MHRIGNGPWCRTYGELCGSDDIATAAPALFVVYLIARIWKRMNDRRKKNILKAKTTTLNSQCSSTTWMNENDRSLIVDYYLLLMINLGVELKSGFGDIHTDRINDDEHTFMKQMHTHLSCCWKFYSHLFLFHFLLFYYCSMPSSVTIIIDLTIFFLFAFVLFQFLFLRLLYYSKMMTHSAEAVARCTVSGIELCGFSQIK